MADKTLELQLIRLLLPEDKLKGMGQLHHYMDMRKLKMGKWKQKLEHFKNWGG